MLEVIKEPVLRAAQPLCLNLKRLSHPYSSTYTRWYDLQSDILYR